MLKVDWLLTEDTCGTEGVDWDSESCDQVRKSKVAFKGSISGFVGRVKQLRLNQVNSLTNIVISSKLMCPVSWVEYINH